MSDGWSYEGKRVVIAGCASGMGEATARELVRCGAEVHGVDVRPSPVDLASFRTCDLRDRGSVDTAVDAIGGAVDALFNCAGLPQTFPSIDVMTVNFIGMRYWTERIAALMNRGGAIATIASTAGFGYLQRLPTVLEFVGHTGFDEARQWCEDHADVVGDGYSFSKEAIIVWTMASAASYIERGFRINCISPAPTSTPMMDEFEKATSAEVVDVFTLPIGRRALATEMASPMVFLNSDGASYINGHNLNVDGGFVGSITTGMLDLAQALVMLG